MQLRFGGFIRDGVEEDSGEIRHKVDSFVAQGLLPTHFLILYKRIEYTQNLQHEYMIGDSVFPLYLFFSTYFAFLLLLLLLRIDFSAKSSMI